MAQQYASGETMRLTLKLTPSATSMTGNKDVGTTSGRFFLSNNNQVEWISFSGITNNGDGTYTYTGLTRGLSQTADPVTAGTGSTWLQNQECILVAMHDQLVDKTQATTFAENITFADDINFSGTTKAGLTIKSLTQAQINALTPVVGYKVFNTDTGTVQTYYSGVWNDEGTSTTPNASTTVAGKVEMATQGEVNAGTSTGGTGAKLVVGPAEAKVVTDALSTSISTVSSAIGTVTMTLGETLSTGDTVSIDSATGKVNKTTITGADTSIASAGGNITFAQVISLSSTTVVFVGVQDTNTAYYARAGTISGSVITLGSAVNLFFGGISSGTKFCGIVALDATTFVAGYEDKTTTSYILNGIVGTVSGTTITAGSPVVIRNSGVTAQALGTVTKVTSSKVAFNYQYGGNNRVTIGTVSGTTLSIGAEQSGFSIQPTVSCYVSDEKYAVCDGANVRFYTTVGTVVTEGNNLALGVTYTSFSVRYLGSSKAVYCGTNGGTTFAFILDLSGATPVAGTVVTVLASSTSNDCFQASSNFVGIATGNNKVYFYSYSGTTLTFENVYTSTSTIGGYNSTNYVADNIFVTNYATGATANGYVMSNRVHYVVGILQSGGVLDDSRLVKVVGGLSTIHSGLTTGLSVYAVATGTGYGNSSGAFYVGKALSATSILVGIPYSTL